MAVPFPAGMVIDQGMDCTFSVIYEDSTGNPVNLTGYTAEFAMREDYGQPVLFTLTQLNGITITPLTGTLTVNIPYTQTGRPEGTYVAELALTSPSKVSLVKGQLPISAKVIS